MTCYDIVDISHYWSFSYNFIHIYIYIIVFRLFNQDILGVSENGVLAKQLLSPSRHLRPFTRPLPSLILTLWRPPKGEEAMAMGRNKWYTMIQHGLEDFQISDLSKSKLETLERCTRESMSGCSFLTPGSFGGVRGTRMGNGLGQNGQQIDQLFNFDQFWTSWYRPVWAAHST